MVPAADNPNVLLVGRAERPTDFSEFEYNQLTGAFGSRFPVELVSTEHLIAANNRILGVPSEADNAFSSPIDLKTTIANRISWENSSLEGASSFIEQVELGVTQKNNYDVIKEGWSAFGDRTIQRLDQAAIQDGGGVLTGIAAVVRMPTEIGIALVEMGLTLGEVLYDTTQYVTESVTGS